ncbi:MAG: threonine synthase [Nitrososphaerota archaeon]|jgi:threonine synthase|nr:threonine synthase [Nitrososphaerota archaeon]
MIFDGIHSGLAVLTCFRCGKEHNPAEVNNTCTKCGGTLLARYDIQKVANTFTKSSLKKRVKSLWRYTELLPLQDERKLVSLGEGLTPILNLKELGREVGISLLMIKDDGILPTGTFKARGQAVAVSRAKELGLKELCVPSAGNAGAAMAAYAARGHLAAHVFLPEDSPMANQIECSNYGAILHLVRGTIADAASEMRKEMLSHEWFDMSTLREPYRVEGKKTMGLEMAEQLDFNLPDVVIYPVGGGTGLIGMWKAFDELEELGLIGSGRPKMVAVQSSGCDPIVKAFQNRKDAAEEFKNPSTVASGLRVPSPFSSELILEVIRRSSGTAVSVSDDEIILEMKKLMKEGISACPEGAATLAGLRRLVDKNWIEKEESVLLYNTGTALKYMHLLGS